MTDLIQNFVAEDFHPEKFVKDLSSQCIGAEELRQQRIKIQELANITSAQLKRNVYQNYIQFIETAKEISYLESEMYQLSQILSEQRSLLSVLSSNQYTGTKLEESMKFIQENTTSLSREEESKQKLIQVLENVEGASSLVDIPGRECLHEGYLLELDPMEGTPLKKVHAYLFNDVLMIANYLTGEKKRTLSRCKMQAVYDLRSLAVVNIRDFGTSKLTFKLLAFPDTRVFQCTTATSKKEWLEKCDQAKKLKTFQQDQSPSKVKNTEAQASLQALRSLSTDSDIAGSENDYDINEELPDWILEVTEDLDSYIAQRHFEEAYFLIQKTKTYLKNTNSNYLLDQVSHKLDIRSNLLISVLTKELEMNSEVMSFQGGGLRSARRAVKLLIQLNRSSQACQLYLRICSSSLKNRLKKVKREEAMLPYVKELSAVAFSGLGEMSREFLQIFPSFTNCTAALAVWGSHEQKHIVSNLLKQIFSPQIPLTTIVECISVIREHCEQLSQIGLDFRCQLDSQLRSPLMRALRVTGDKYIDAIKIRASEDVWKPTNFPKAQQLQQLLSELDDLGIPVPTSYVKNEFWIPLTNSTINFSKLYISLLEDCLNVTTPETLVVVEDVLISVLQVELHHIQTSVSNPKMKDKKLIHDNAKYIHDVVISRSLELYKSVIGYPFEKLIKLQEQFRSDDMVAMMKLKRLAKTSIPKYSNEEYL